MSGKSNGPNVINCNRPNEILRFFDKVGWRIRQNGLAHSPKWTSVCMIHHTCAYIRAGWGLLRLGTLSRGLGPPGPTPQKPPAHSNIYTCIVYHACAGPFWRMRQSILSNAPIYFIECACLFWRMNEWLNEWMTKWMNQWMTKWMTKWMNAWMKNI